MDISGVEVTEPEVHTDYRGDLWTLWHADKHRFNFNHDKVSTSRRHVLRGIHGDQKSWKLVTCLHGEIYFVVADPRPDSPTHMKWDSMVLDSRRRAQVLVPPGVGNGFLVLSDESVFHYKWLYPGTYPDVDDQFTIKWNDPFWNINWPIDNPILQARDKK